MSGLETPSNNEIHDPNGWHGDVRAWQEMGNPMDADLLAETSWNSDRQYDTLTFDEVKADAPIPKMRNARSWRNRLGVEVPAANPESSREVEEVKEIGKAALSGATIFDSEGEDGLQKETHAETTPEINRDTKEQFAVPRGWTTLIHGTDSIRWKLGEPVKTVARMGLSAITTEDAVRDRVEAERLGNPVQYNTTESYARKGNEGGEPVEVRVFFYREDLSRQRVPAADVADIKASLSPEMLSLITKYHQPRHAVIPRNEQLIRLGQGFDDTSGRQIEYFVPRSVAADYLEAMARESVD